MIQGSLVALVTPFRGGELDIEGLKTLVDWHIDQGSHGLVPVGTTGESPTLSHEEHDLVVETVVAQAAGRVPVIAGAGVQQYGRNRASGKSRKGRRRRRGPCGDALLQ